MQVPFMAKEWRAPGLHVDFLVIFPECVQGQERSACRSCSVSLHLSQVPLPLIQDLLKDHSLRQAFPCFSTHSPLRSLRKVVLLKAPCQHPVFFSGSLFCDVIESPRDFCPPILLLHLTLYLAPCCYLSTESRVQHIGTQYLFVV